MDRYLAFKELFLKSTSTIAEFSFTGLFRTDYRGEGAKIFNTR